MTETEQRLREEVEELLRRAQEVDADRGDELPEELARRESRLKKIKEAKAALEAEAREEAEKKKAGAEARLAERRAAGTHRKEARRTRSAYTRSGDSGAGGEGVA